MSSIRHIFNEETNIFNEKVKVQEKLVAKKWINVEPNWICDAEHLKV